MKNNIKWIIIAVAFVVFIGGATILYNNLSKDFGGDKLLTNTSEAQNTENAQQDNSNESEKIKAPDFTVLDYEGNEVKLSDFEGKPVVLNFWATWCYYCKEEMPDFNKAYKENPDVQFLMVNATDGVRETVEIAKQYITEQGFEFPVVFDTKQEAVYAYYVTGYPATYFIDKNGKFVTYANGMLSYDNLLKGISFITED